MKGGDAKLKTMEGGEIMIDFINSVQLFFISIELLLIVLAMKNDK